MNSTDNQMNLDWEKGCYIDFDFLAGQCIQVPTKKRKLSEMRGMYLNETAFEVSVSKKDCVVYEYHALNIPHTSGDLSFGFSILQPGKVGDEYYFTKGHFHKIQDTCEIYYCSKGHGYLLIESKDGSFRALEMHPGRIGYVPKGYAHRSVNVSLNEPFVTFFVYQADAGHNYATIKTQGFRKLLVDKKGIPTLVDNPRWKTLK